MKTQRFNPFQELLYSRKNNPNKLHGALGCGYATAWKKVKDPMLFTIKDLLRMEACGVATLDEMFDAIKEMKR